MHSALVGSTYQPTIRFEREIKADPDDTLKASVTGKVFFSVLIPAYNCADSIADTVRSVLHAGLTELEILIIDDGSTDGTAAVLSELSSQYANVKVLSQPNGGVSSARNLGLSHAQGDYLIFVDADDVVPENAYKQAAEIVLETKPDMLLFGMYFEHVHAGILYQSEKLVCPVEGLLTDDKWRLELDALFRCNYLSPIWNKIIRRDVIHNHKIRFSEDMFLMEDCRFSLDCLQYCHSVYLLPEPIYRYQIPDDGKKAAERIRRVKSLNTYMDHFSELTGEFPSVIRAIHHMLFRQRLASAKTTDEIYQEIQEFKQSAFYEEGILPEQLLIGHDRRYLLGNRIGRLRHRTVVAYKTTRLRLKPGRNKTENGLTEQ